MLYLAAKPRPDFLWWPSQKISLPRDKYGVTLCKTGKKNWSTKAKMKSIAQSATAKKKKKGGILPRRSDGKFTARTETIRKIVNHSSSDQHSALKLRYQISATQAHGQVHTSINDRWKEMEKKREGGPESVSVPLLLAG